MSTFNKNWIRRKRSFRKVTQTFKGSLVSVGEAVFGTAAVGTARLCHLALSFVSSFSLVWHIPSNFWEQFVSKFSVFKGLGNRMWWSGVCSKGYRGDLCEHWPTAVSPWGQGFCCVQYCVP